MRELMKTRPIIVYIVTRIESRHRADLLAVAEVSGHGHFFVRFYEKNSSLSSRFFWVCEDLHLICRRPRALNGCPSKGSYTSSSFPDDDDDDGGGQNSINRICFNNCLTIVKNF